MRCRLLSENKYFVPLFIFLISLINITKDTKNHSQCQVLFIWKGDYIGVPQNKIPYSCGFAPPHHCKIPCFWGFLRVGGKVGLKKILAICSLITKSLTFKWSPKMRIRFLKLMSVAVLFLIFSLKMIYPNETESYNLKLSIFSNCGGIKTSSTYTL